LIRQKARAVSRDAGPWRVFEALCVIVVISGSLAASGVAGAIIGGSDFLFSLLKVIIFLGVVDDFGTVWSTARGGQGGKARTARGKKLQDREKKMSSQVVQVAASRCKYRNCRGLGLHGGFPS
jgi:hypothetical protein